MAKTTKPKPRAGRPRLRRPETDAPDRLSAHVAAVLRERRHQLGLSGTDVAARTDGYVNAHKLVEMEAGRSLRFGALVVLCYALGLNLNSLLPPAVRAAFVDRSGDGELPRAVAAAVEKL